MTISISSPIIISKTFSLNVRYTFGLMIVSELITLVLLVAEECLARNGTIDI